MKYLNTVTAILILIAAAGIVSAADVPKLSITETNLEFGDISQGEPLDLVYEVTNSGGGNLEITVRPTCGCTVVETVESVPAGQSGTIRATIDTSKLSGPVSKSLLVLSNDPARPNLKLTAKATVNPA